MFIHLSIISQQKMFCCVVWICRKLSAEVLKPSIYSFPEEKDIRRMDGRLSTEAQEMPMIGELGKNTVRKPRKTLISWAVTRIGCVLEVVYE